MATIKSYTDLEQSKELAEIIPLESSDMCYPPYYIGDEDGDHLYYSLPLLEYKEKCAYNRDNKDEYIPCWSLAALLEQLPFEICDDDGNSVYLQISKENDVYQLVYEDHCLFSENIETDRYEHFIDACYAMIIKLHELNLL